MMKEKKFVDVLAQKRRVRFGFVLFILSVYLGFLSSNCILDQSKKADLSPSNWPEGDLEKYTLLNNIHENPHPLAEGAKGMIAGTQEALAVRAGLEALKQGGSAADAALTAALTQNALAAGCWVSYAGRMTLVYYEAATGEVYFLNAGWNSVLEEDDPLSIPFQDPIEKPLPGTPSGRSALVPGYMAGVQAAHDRFGKLPFSALFEPSIYFAEQGFDISSKLAGYIEFREDVLTRLPETRKIFTKENGNLYKEGDLFKQPQLAETLKKVAYQGADYMYRGTWAENFVDAVREEGGKMTLKDLEDYRVIWSEPFRTTYRDYEVIVPALPNFGGVNTIEALNLLELADLPHYGHYTKSPEALYQFIQISRMHRLSGFFQDFFPEMDFSYQSRMKKKTAQFIWHKMQSPEWPDMMNKHYEAWQGSNTIEKPKHSEAIVAVDKWGNVTALLHTINTVFWGMTGIFVDGISVSDAACFQQQRIKDVGPGMCLPDMTNPLIVLQKGRPILASSCIGSGLHEETIQKLINVLDYGMNPKTAVDTVSFLMPARNLPEIHKQVLVKGEFSNEVIEGVRELGQELKLVPNKDRIRWQGCWVGITIDPKTGKLLGGAPWQKNGLAEGY